MEVNNLPCYQLEIDPDQSSDVQVDYVALVDMPAIEKNFLAFKSEENKASLKRLDFAAVNEEERIVIGAAMIPDLAIYRNDPTNGEYYVTFSKDTVKQIAEKFYSKGFQNNANLMHDAAQKVEGVCYFLSFIRDSAKGMIGLAGDYPEGTWFLGAKVNNDEAWAKVKSGEIKGFSVEGIFQYRKTQLSAEKAFELIREIIENLTL
jgi:hypothetical protein